jgi:N6-adenosine-specific RNA methylase IME4
MNAPLTQLTAHPAAELFPMLDDARLAELAADIRENGLREPIQMLDGRIIDGRNRYRACQMAGVTPQFRQMPIDVNPWALVWSLNGQRRDLNNDQRYILWAECAENDVAWQTEQKRIHDEANRKRSEAMSGVPFAPKGEPRKNEKKVDVQDVQKHSGDNAKTASTRNKKADAANVDAGTVARNDFLKKHRPDLHAKVRTGELTSSRAYTAAKKDDKVAKLTDISAQEVRAASGVYDVIVLDPPWQMEKIEREVAPNQAAFDYPTMDEEALAALEIPAADDCHLWVWTTHKHLPMSLRLIKAWGLKYVCTFVWHKPGGFQPFGLPQYNCEFAIYARKGAPIFIETKAFPVCFNAPRGAHSEKPEDFYDVIRRVTAGRRLDMFNRRKIEGFDGWGNEAA